MKARAVVKLTAKFPINGCRLSRKLYAITTIVLPHAMNIAGKFMNILKIIPHANRIIVYLCAARTDMRPAGSTRCGLLMRSMSRSQMSLMTFAPAAMHMPENKAQKTVWQAINVFTKAAASTKLSTVKATLSGRVIEIQALKRRSIATLLDFLRVDTYLRRHCLPGEARRKKPLRAPLHTQHATHRLDFHSFQEDLMRSATMWTRFVLLAGQLMLGRAAVAQITVTSDDLLALRGKSQMAESDTTGNVTVNVGSAGANRTWDFRALVLQPQILTNQFLAPQNTPFAGQFPQSNFVQKSISSAAPDFESYLYFQAAGNGLNF